LHGCTGLTGVGLQGGGMEIDDFREELLDTVVKRQPDNPDDSDRCFAFVCEVGERLTQAEEFHDFIPASFTGVGSRNRKLQVDGYEFDEADDSIHLIIANFSGASQAETITRTKAESSFAKLHGFVEDSISGRIWDNVPDGMEVSLELAKMLEDKHSSIVRYRFFLLTDAVLSSQLKDLPQGELNGLPVEYRVWDVGRLFAVSSSTFGAEEIEIDFTKFVPGGLPCLPASRADDYEGYLAVIPGDALTGLYDTYGSKLLEGNVRSYLSAAGKVNKGIQATIRSEPERFFVYNNGITVTATSADVTDTPQGKRLISAKYFQIVNGGQTTASLHAALKKDKADLKDIHVQMKLSVVKGHDVEKLDDLIQKIAKYSNKQNAVNEADFFSNHPFHRAMERISRRLPAPAAVSAQYSTFWFYERARGQYQNLQSGLTQSRKKDFLLKNPRPQKIVKTDLAKYENSWKQLPHIVCTGAQKNFKNFAEYVDKNWGDDGARFDNDIYFKEMVARAILFKSVEKLVSSADWYEPGGYRSQIVTYSIAKLASIIELQKQGYSLDFKALWASQSLSSSLVTLLNKITKDVVESITSPPVQQMNVGEWCKKVGCWEEVLTLPTRLTEAVASELVSPDEVSRIRRQSLQSGNLDSGIKAVTTVITLGPLYWHDLSVWARKYSPIYGKEADLVRNASRKGWIPTPSQAACLVKVSERLDGEGFVSS